MRLRLINTMLLLKTDRHWKQVLANAFTPLIIFPATVPGETRDESKKRANDLVVTARIAGIGVTVVESTTGDLYVMASDNESQSTGFARKMLLEQKLAEPWFLLLRDEKGPLLKEDSNRLRESCELTETGFVLPDGQVVVITKAYAVAQRNTAWGHSLGHYVGEHL